MLGLLRLLVVICGSGFLYIGVRWLLLNSWSGSLSLFVRSISRGLLLLSSCWLLILEWCWTCCQLLAQIVEGQRCIEYHLRARVARWSGVMLLRDAQLVI